MVGPRQEEVSVSKRHAKGCGGQRIAVTATGTEKHVFLRNNSTALTYRQPGERLSKDEVHYPRDNLFCEDVVAIATLLLFFG